LLSKLLRFRTLWAYGFDSAAPRALEKSKVGEKEKTFFLQPNLLFKKLYRGNKEAREAIQGVKTPGGQVLIFELFYGIDELLLALK